jgi:hypothetical protein
MCIKLRSHPSILESSFDKLKLVSSRLGSNSSEFGLSPATFGQFLATLDQVIAIGNSNRSGMFSNFELSDKKSDRCIQENWNRTFQILKGSVFGMLHPSI